MPGVSSRQPVSGMYGIGKIHLKFKPKPKRKFPWGALFFISAAIAYLMVFLNSMPWTRHQIVIPVLRSVYVSYGYVGQLIQKRDIQLQGSSDPINVFKNAQGIGFVRAESVVDAMYGQGFLHASQSLYSLEMRRRTASGRLAAAEGYLALPSDRLARVINFEDRARQDLLVESKENVELLEAYASGVNAYINSIRLPSLSLLIAGIFSVEEWSPAHSLMLMRLDAFVEQSSIQKAALNYTLQVGINTDLAIELMQALEGGSSLSSVHDSTAATADERNRHLVSSLATAWASMDTASGAPLLATSLSTLVCVDR
jgi:acyl-homoserine lactone acylase PvdQ